MEQEPNTEERFFEDGEKKKFDDFSKEGDPPPKNSQVGIILLVSLLVLGLAFVVVLMGEEKEETPENLDQRLIQDVKSRSKALSDSERTAKEEKQPEMVYIPAGPVVLGIFEREYAYNLATEEFCVLLHWSR